MNPDKEYLADQLWKCYLSGKPHLKQTGDRRHIELWIRHKYRCEYCGEPLLSDLIRFYSAQLDHLLPKAKYPDETIKDNPDNWVLSCYTCNQIKRAFDPWEKLMGRGKSSEQIDINANREALLQECRKYIDEKKEKWNATREKVIAITGDDNRT